MTTPNPAARVSKPWRVYGPRANNRRFRTRRAAYEHVQQVVKAGHAATVYHWQGGRWALYERIDAAA